MAQDWAF